MVSGHLQRQWTRVDSQLFTNVFLSLLVCKMWYRKNLAPTILKLVSFSAFELKEINLATLPGAMTGPKNFYVNWGGGCVVHLHPGDLGSNLAICFDLESGKGCPV